MGLRVSTAARNAAGDALTALLDAGGGPGSIEVRSGSQPSSPDAAATGTLLVTFTLALPSYADFADGTGALGTVASADAVATGEAGWYRMLDGTGVAVIDGTAGTAGTQLVLNTASIVSGGSVSVTSGSLTMPTGV